MKISEMWAQVKAWAVPVPLQDCAENHVYKAAREDVDEIRNRLDALQDRIDIMQERRQRKPRR